MSDFYIGQIILFAGDFAIQGFVSCQGQSMPIAQHHALFSLLGTTFGGDGHSTFGVPDLRGRAPVHEGQVSGGGATHRRGDAYGRETLSLGQEHLPTHSHQASYSGGGSSSASLKAIPESSGNDTSPSDGQYLAASSGGPTAADIYRTKQPSDQTVDLGGLDISGGGFNPDNLKIENTGGGQAFPTAAPRLALNFQLCMDGIYPPRP